MATTVPTTTSSSTTPRPHPAQPLRQRPFYLIRFTQTHIDFRTAELAALEALLDERLRRIRKPSSADGAAGEHRLEALRRKGCAVRLEVVRYDAGSPFCVVRFRVVVRGRGRKKAPEWMGDGPGGKGGEVRWEGQGRREGDANAVLGEGEGRGRRDGEGTGEVARPELNGEDSEIDCEENYDEELLAEVARAFILRSVQAKGIYEIWGYAAVDGSGMDGELPLSRPEHLNGTNDHEPETVTDTTAPSKPSPNTASIDLPEPTTSTTTTTPTPNTALPALYTNLHASTHTVSAHRWPPYQTSATLKFKLSVDSFNHARTAPEQRDIINSFAFLDFAGLVRMKDYNEEWVVFEEWLGPPKPISDPIPNPNDNPNATANGTSNGSPDDNNHTSTAAASAPSQSPRQQPQQVYANNHRRLSRLWFTRAVGTRTLRHLVEKHDLKKRPYISTTSMDAELALVTANLALAGGGKMFLDPFCGTGGFLIAAAELGAWMLGSDIDGRSFRGKGDRGLEGGVGRNVKKYGLQAGMGGCFTGDLVNSPLIVGGEAGGKGRRWLDGIVADPPYGVREGLKVLGARRPPEEVEGSERMPHLIDGVPAHTLPGYVAPKKPYSFERMLDNVLDFAFKTLVDGGRLAFWMPSANENEKGEEEETRIPQHPGLTLLHVCVQRFNRWSRRLLVYERRSGHPKDIDLGALESSTRQMSLNGGVRADDLNPFRRRYFQAFAVDGESQSSA